ncbi:hypothetical protein CEXT_27251 [Caerostris extrusa]|uniref:Uncharacterized protein n=1 Tax=Caerostris extrusa TaxID=172846 RepID=A0AAV4WVH2_CAEEX|nr:hypothetical protein CEXT_27251 [Caerostris extrusa]
MPVMKEPDGHKVSKCQGINDISASTHLPCAMRNRLFSSRRVSRNELVQVFVKPDRNVWILYFNDVVLVLVKLDTKWLNLHP